MKLAVVRALGLALLLLPAAATAGIHVDVTRGSATNTQESDRQGVGFGMTSNMFGVFGIGIEAFRMKSPGQPPPAWAPENSPRHFEDDQLTAGFLTGRARLPIHPSFGFLMEAGAGIARVEQGGITWRDMNGADFTTPGQTTNGYGSMMGFGVQVSPLPVPLHLELGVRRIEIRHDNGDMKFNAVRLGLGF